MSEHEGSEGGGEGLSAAEALNDLCNAFDRNRYDTHDWCLTHDVAVEPDGPCPVTTANVERILVDRLAAVQAEQAAMWEPIVRTATWRLAIAEGERDEAERLSHRRLERWRQAESARDTALRERADVEARLAGDSTAADRRDVARWLVDEADQRVKFFPQRRDGVDALLRHIASALANPSATQREAEVGARACRYPCGCDEFPEEHCSCMDGHTTDEAEVSR